MVGVEDDWQAYLRALRPWFYPMSCLPSVLGCLLSYRTTERLDWLLAVITLLVVFAVHTAGILVNTYNDFLFDDDKRNGKTQTEKRLKLETVRQVGTTSYAFGALLFGVLICLSSAHYLGLSVFFFLGLSGSFLYTNGPAGLKKIGVGDIVIVITFGPLTAIFSYLACGGPFSLNPILKVFLLSLPLAMLAEAALHSNNTRDLEIDRRRGMTTLPILLGRGWSFLIYCCLLVLPYVILVVLIVRCSLLFTLPMLTLLQALKLEKEFRSGHLQTLPRQTMQLNFLFGLLYVPLFYFVQKLTIL